MLFILRAMGLAPTPPAADAVDLDAYQLILSITFEETFSDNYFLVNDDLAGAESALISVFTPDLRLEVGERHRFYLGFKSDLIVVEGFEEENRQNQIYTAGIEYNPGPRLSVKIKDTLKDIRDQGATRPVVGDVERTVWVQNDLQTAVTYKYTERLGSEVILSWASYDHAEINEHLTRDEYHATIRGVYLVSPRTEAFLGYRYSDFIFTDLRSEGARDMDNQGHTVQVGLKLHQMPLGAGRLRGEVWAGYQLINFERQEDQNEFVLHGRLTYMATPRMDVVLRLDREHDASPIDSGTNVINTKVKADLVYSFLEKFLGSVGVGYTNSDYTEPAALRGARDERTDNIITFNASVRYNLYKYLTARAGYDFVNKSVDPTVLDVREYMENRVTVSLNGTF